MSWSKTRPHWYKWIQPVTRYVDPTDPSKGAYRLMEKVEKKLTNTYYRATDSLGLHYQNLQQADVVTVDMPKIDTVVRASVKDILQHNMILQWGGEVRAYFPLSKWELVSGPADWQDKLRKYTPPVKKSKHKLTDSKGNKYTEEGLAMIEEQNSKRNSI